MPGRPKYREPLHKKRKEASSTTIGDHSKQESSLKVNRMSSKKRKLRSTNTTGFRGVSKAGGNGERFRAKIRIEGRYKHLGTHGTAKEAALAFDRAVTKHRLSPSRLNYPAGLLASNDKDYDQLLMTQTKNTKLPAKNTTGYRGVTKWENRFQAQITVGIRNHKHLGTYETAKEAALNYDRAAIQQKFKSSKLNFPDGLPLDDEDYDELMNPKKRKLSSANTTGYRGVVKIGKRFQAQIFSGKKREYLGTYDDPKEAAHAYDRAAIKHKLPSHKLNFPPESTSSDEDDEDNSGKKSGAAVDDGNDDEATHELSPFSPAHLPFQGDPMLDQLVAAVEAQTKQSK